MYWRRNIVVASSRLENKDEDEVLPLTACERQLSQGNIITNESRDLMYAFWTSETRVSPNKKDIEKKRIEKKSVVKHLVHLLDDSQVITILCNYNFFGTSLHIQCFYAWCACTVQNCNYILYCTKPFFTVSNMVFCCIAMIPEPF